MPTIRLEFPVDGWFYNAEAEKYISTTPYENPYNIDAVWDELGLPWADLSNTTWGYRLFEAYTGWGGDVNLIRPYGTAWVYAMDELVEATGIGYGSNLGMPIEAWLDWCGNPAWEYPEHEVSGVPFYDPSLALHEKDAIMHHRGEWGNTYGSRHGFHWWWGLTLANLWDSVGAHFDGPVFNVTGSCAKYYDDGTNPKWEDVCGVKQTFYHHNTNIFGAGEYASTGERGLESMDDPDEHPGPTWPTDPSPYYTSRTIFTTDTAGFAIRVNYLSISRYGHLMMAYTDKPGRVGPEKYDPDTIEPNGWFPLNNKVAPCLSRHMYQFSEVKYDPGDDEVDPFDSGVMTRIWPYQIELSGGWNGDAPGSLPGSGGGGSIFPSLPSWASSYSSPSPGFATSIGRKGITGHRGDGIDISDSHGNYWFHSVAGSGTATVDELEVQSERRPDRSFRLG